MKVLALPLFVLGAATWSAQVCTAEPWHEPLRRMPLIPETVLNRDNCIPVLLGAFRSNHIVKALVFLPGVSDDFYLINREGPKLNIKATNLLEAITAITNATAVRITFSPPFLLLHLERDQTQPSLTIQPAADALKRQTHIPRASWVDMHWERVQPILEGALRVKILPAAKSEDAWHFARHNLAAWNLTDWELLSALSLTGRTKVSIERRRIMFALPQAP